MTILQHVVDIVAPWKQRYDDSTNLQTAVVAVHLTALLVGGGLAIAADRATLRVGGRDGDARARQLDEIGNVHRPVLIALAALFVSGLALTAADLETYIASPVYWIKFGFIVLLLANGVIMTRTEQALHRASAGDTSRLDALWRRMRFNAWSSVALWITTLVLGTALVNNA